jgi:hypothetical protein
MRLLLLVLALSLTGCVTTSTRRTYPPPGHMNGGGGGRASVEVVINTSHV